MKQTTMDAGRFDVAKIAATLPETAATLLVDHYLTNRPAAAAANVPRLAVRATDRLKSGQKCHRCRQGW